MALPDQSAWRSSLPGTIAELTSRWSLTIGKPFDAAGGTGSWVARATLKNGTSAVLKIGMPHMESTHEADGLRFWSGDGTVRLLEADEKSGAMLIELCEPGTPLREIRETEQDEVIAGLLRRLWQLPPAPHPFRPLTMMIDHWVRESMAAAKRWGDSGLVQEGLDLLNRLSRSAPTEVLLMTDLHAGNVLRAKREPWLVIDPKPFIGDPAYDATQHLLNCRERLKHDWRGTIRRFADLLEMDAERVRLWLFARAAAEPRGEWRSDGLSDLARRLSGR
jgi:streptomycin 6-kinase